MRRRAGYAEDWDTDTLWAALKTLYPISLTPTSIHEAHGDLTRDSLLEAVLADAHKAWADREEALTPEITRELERRVVLSVLDRKWREHLYEMDYLKEGIGLRAMAQRDPLIEYQREGFDMFGAMLDSLKEESVGFLYNLQVQVVPAEGEAPAAEVANDETAAVAGSNGASTQAVGSGQNGKSLPAPKPVGGKQAGAVRTRVRPVTTASQSTAFRPGGNGHRRRSGCVEGEGSGQTIGPGRHVELFRTE